MMRTLARQKIIQRGLVSQELYAELESTTRALFARGTDMASKQGLILVDTKYEFGLKNGQLFLIDEIHTPDSSRYFIKEGYQERQESNENQKQLSKEFVREWLMEHDFMGLDGQIMPAMPPEFIEKVSQRYIGLYEQVTGQPFLKQETESLEQEIHEAVSQWIAENSIHA